MLDQLYWNNPDTIHRIFKNALDLNELNELLNTVLTRILELENVSYEQKVELISQAKEIASKSIPEFYIGTYRN